MILRNKNRKGKVTSYGVRLYRGKVDGKEAWEWVGSFPTVKAAKVAEADALTKRAEAANPLLCDELAAWFLDRYERHKASSVDVARAAIKRWLKTFEGVPVTEIDTDMAEAWAKDNQSAVPVVVTMFNQAVARHAGVTDNPFRGLTQRSVGRRDVEPLTVAQVATLASCASTTGVSALITFAAYTGLRQGEVFALEWRDIDLEANRARVRRRLYRGRLDLPKSGKPRLCVLLPEARDALLSLGAKREGLVFTTERGKGWTAGGFAYHWKGILGTFGKRVAFHELRHFTGHHMYVTMDLKSRTVAAQLGHSTPRLVEDLYGHWRSGALDELDRAIGANVAQLRVAADENQSNGVG